MGKTLDQRTLEQGDRAGTTSERRIEPVVPPWPWEADDCTCFDGACMRDHENE